MQAQSYAHFNQYEVGQDEMAYGTDTMPKLDKNFENSLTDWYAGYKNRLNDDRTRFDIV